MSEDVALTLVVAAARDGGIGRQGRLLFRLKSDMAHFRAVTAGKPVLMGRKTWATLSRRPLPGRANLVVTRNIAFEAPAAFVASNLALAIGAARRRCA